MDRTVETLGQVSTNLRTTDQFYNPPSPLNVVVLWKKKNVANRKPHETTLSREEREKNTFYQIASQDIFEKCVKCVFQLVLSKIVAAVNM